MAKKQNISYQDIGLSLEVFKLHEVSPSGMGYETLKAFGKNNADIRRYREGKGILSSFDGLFCYKHTVVTKLASTLEKLKTSPQVIKVVPKIIAMSDGKTINGQLLSRLYICQ